MDIVTETQSAATLALAAKLVSTFSLNIINTTIGVVPELEGDLLSTNVVEEMALSEFQKRLIAKGEVK